MVHSSRRPHCPLLFLVALVLTIVTATADRGCCDGCVGCYYPLGDVNHPTIRRIAEFAVSNYNKKQSRPSDRLVLRNVGRGHSQMVNGVNYELVITAVNESLSANNSPPIEYQVRVHEALPCNGGAMTLRSFYRLKN